SQRSKRSCTRWVMARSRCWCSSNAQWMVSAPRSAGLAGSRRVILGASLALRGGGHHAAASPRGHFMIPSKTSAPDLPFERHTLSNGLRIILHRDTTLPLVAVNLWYHVGSKNEKPGRTGFAHLFEHMLFQGSQHIPVHEHFRFVQLVGGITNGSTWY